MVLGIIIIYGNSNINSIHCKNQIKNNYNITTIENIKKEGTTIHWDGYKYASANEMVNNNTYPLSFQFYAISLADNNKENILKYWIG